MRRNAILLALLVVVSLVGCARKGGYLDRVKARWSKTATVVAKLKPATPLPIQIDATAIAKQTARDAIEQRVAQAGPIDLHHTVGDNEQQSQDRAAPAPAPDIKVDRRSAAPKKSMFRLDGQPRSGKNFCEAHASLEACNASCTSMLRSASMQQGDVARSCACVESTSSCR